MDHARDLFFTFSIRTLFLMIMAVKIDRGPRINTVGFAHAKAILPFYETNHSLKWLPWGRRHFEAGNLPLGGWVKITALNQGEWDEFFPKYVRIPALSFMDRDIEGTCHWHDLVKGHYLQGIMANFNRERRIYLVILTPKERDSLYERWPNIVTHPL